MDIKQYKKDLETKTVEIIKKMVSETVNVESLYNLESDTISVLLTEEKFRDNDKTIRDSILVYSCSYDFEKDAFSVAGFNRRYGFDAFGIAQVVNDPITVDEIFIANMKTGLRLVKMEPAIPAEESVAPVEA